jgi:hypothetical protein
MNGPEELRKHYDSDYAALAPCTQGQGTGLDESNKI